MSEIDLKTREATESALAKLHTASRLAVTLRRSSDGMAREAGQAILDELSEVRHMIKGYPHNPGDICSLCGTAPDDADLLSAIEADGARMRGRLSEGQVSDREMAR